MAIHFKSKLFLLFTMGVLGLILVGVASCARTNSIFPFNEALLPPIKVTASQLYAEYEADEAAAYAKYKGVRVWFTRVTVEEVSGLQATRTPTGGLFYRTPYGAFDIFVMADSIKFKPRYSGITFTISEGCKVDIVGEVQRLEDGILIVEDSLIELVEGKPGDIY